MEPKQSDHYLQTSINPENSAFDFDLATSATASQRT